MSIKTRFAPSPTGVLHLGSIRTALFCWLYARNQDGVFLLRVEDTDRERSTEANVQAITEGLKWLGLEADEGPIFQTQRMDRYRMVLDQWLEEGKAYRCYCTREELDDLRDAQMQAGEKTRYDGRCRDRTEARAGVDPVIRFRNPDTGKVVVADEVRGRVEFDNEELDDLIICRSDGMPTYNFAVVIDDSDMQVTHVIRGDDHLNNTPRQLNMIRALGASVPTYAHLPMILGPDGAKLSKRHGAVDIREYEKQGYLPEALLNYLVRLGWSHGDQEVFSIDQMIEFFDIADVNQSASSFSPGKMLWLNKQHIMMADASRLAELLEPHMIAAGYDLQSGPTLLDVVEAYRERADTLKEMVDSCWYLFHDFEEFDPNAAKKHLRPVILEPLMAVRSELAELSEWSAESVAATIENVAEKFELKLGKLGQPVRVSVTGGGVSPPIDTTVYLVGQHRAVDRIGIAIEYIKRRVNSG